MMTRVPIISAGNSSVETGGGVTREVIGTGRAAASDVAWAMGDFVFYPGKPASRPPILWRKGIKPHFANAGALKMYWLDDDFTKIEKTVDITQPVDETTKATIDATLVLHCYSEAAEYLVWFAEPESDDYYRCIIQRDGKTVDDFTSVFTSMPAPELADAYIKDSTLVWVATVVNNNYSIEMAKYTNGTLVESKLYDPDNGQTALNTAVDDLYEPAANAASVSVVNTSRIQTTTPMITRRDRVFGKTVEETISGLSVYHSITTNSGSSYYSLVDLWNLDYIEHRSGNTSWQAKYVVHHDQYNIDGSLFASYDLTLASAWLEAETAGNYSHAAAKFQSLMIVPDVETVIDENPEISITSNYSVTKTSDEVLSYSVSTAISATSFKFQHDGSSREFLNAPAGCTLTFTSGPNAGQSKVVKSHSGAESAGHQWTYTVSFDSAWGTAPAAGDTFELEVAYADYDADILMGDVTLSANCPSADSGDDSVVTTDFGNGFSSVQTLPKAVTETWQFPTQDIKYNDASAYPTSARPQSYFPFGAWGPRRGLLVNYDDKLLAVDDSGVSVTAFSLFNGTVTKRFSK